MVEQARSGDVLSRMAVDYFIEIYGSETGNLALKLLPKGGIYIMGGVTRHIMEQMKSTNIFINNYYRKGRFEEVLKSIPIYLVKAEIGSKGCEEYALRQFK